MISRSIETARDWLGITALEARIRLLEGQLRRAEAQVDDLRRRLGELSARPTDTVGRIFDAFRSR